MISGRYRLGRQVKETGQRIEDQQSSVPCSGRSRERTVVEAAGGRRVRTGAQTHDKRECSPKEDEEEDDDGRAEGRGRARGKGAAQAGDDGEGPEHAGRSDEPKRASAEALDLKGRSGRPEEVPEREPAVDEGNLLGQGDADQSQDWSEVVYKQSISRCALDAGRRRGGHTADDADAVELGAGRDGQDDEKASSVAGSLGEVHVALHGRAACDVDRFPDLSDLVADDCGP